MTSATALTAARDAPDERVPDAEGRDESGRHARDRGSFDRASRLAALPGIMRDRIVILDGAMGTMLQAHRFGEADFRGERFRDHPRDLRGNSTSCV